MAALLDIALLFAFIVAGFLASRLGARAPAARWLPRATDLLLKASLWSLLLVMGFRLGSDPALRGNLGGLGLMALASAFLAVSGTLLALLACDRLVRGARREGEAGKPARPSHGEGGHASAESLWRQFRGPLALFALVVLGFAAGALVERPEGLDLDTLSSLALKALLFFIGAQFAQSGISLRDSLMKPAVLVIPLATALGSILPGLLLMPLFDLPLGKALALQAGFGWYSLSGLLIAGLGDPALGSASFLSNMAREAMAFALIPFLSRTRRPWLGIGVGGATAMDVTLPIVEQCAGPQWVPASFTSGAILSMLVPLVVPLFFGL